MKPFRNPRNVHGQQRRHGGHQDHDFQEEYLYQGPHQRQAGFDDLNRANDGYGRAYTRYDHGYSDYHRREYDFYNEGGRYVSPNYGGAYQDTRMHDWPEQSARNWRYLKDPARRVTDTDHRVRRFQGDPFAHHRTFHNPYARHSGQQGSEDESRRHQRNYQGDDLIGGLSDERSGYGSAYPDNESQGRFRRRYDSTGRKPREITTRRGFGNPIDDFGQNPEWDL